VFTVVLVDDADIQLPSVAVAVYVPAGAVTTPAFTLTPVDGLNV